MRAFSFPAPEAVHLGCTVSLFETAILLLGLLQVIQQAGGLRRALRKLFRNPRSENDRGGENKPALGI